jgi:hypothetical protein
MKRLNAFTFSCNIFPAVFSLACLLLLALPATLHAQGFEPIAQPYVVPTDGAVHGTVPIGLARWSNASLYHSAVGTHEWDTRDMDGDGLPDMVVTSEATGGAAAVLGGTANPHWMVYPGTLTGFSSAPITWELPQGGFESDTAYLGFHYLQTTYAANGGQIGCQVWTTRDMDADGRPDLVVMSEKVNSDPATYVFRNGNQAYWKVYLNTGNGFASNPVQWNVPDGGNIYNNTSTGFHIDHFASFYQQSPITHQSWDMRDMDGDGKGDLVVMSLDGECMGLPNQPEWWVYFNNGSGFDQTATSWFLPAGGFHHATQGDVGFVMMDGFLTSGFAGSNKWSVRDMDHDGLLDLVVTSESSSNPGYAPVFGLPGSPHWRVFRNNGTRFEANATLWPVPDGGTRDGTLITGFDYLSPTGGPPRGVDSENWDVVDIDGDGLEDLIVTSELQTDGSYAYQPDDHPYWRVFLNRGNGFDTTAFHWPIPYGGRRSAGTLKGFVNTQDNAIFNDEINSHNWILRDMNDDLRPDFVLTGKKRRMDADGIVFGLDTNFTHWRVYWNTAAALGDAEPTKEMDLRLFPNPAADVLYINIPERGGDIAVFDLHGREAYRATLHRNELHAIQLTNWSRGMYFVEFSDAKGKISKKVLVQ